MKKQLFLLSMGLMLLSQFAVADSCSSSCNTSCSTSCSSSSKSCKSNCLNDHGKTYRRVENAYQAATPIMVGMTQTNRMRSLEVDDKKGQFEITVYGGANTHRADAACYFMPYGHSKYTFSGDVSDTVKTFARVAALSAAQSIGGSVNGDETGTATTGALVNPDTLGTDPGTIKIDTNKDTSIIRPWNFGITFAALFEPTGAEANGARVGTGLVTNPEFNSTIAPELRHSRVGFGLGLRYHFSEEKEGFFGTLTTSVEHVRSRICLNETEVTAKTNIDSDLAAGNPRPGITSTGTAASNAAALFDITNTATAAPVGSVSEAYLNGTTGTGFPVDATVDNGGTAPKNVTEAFDQAAWNYGKIGCEQKETRLADIELAVGYQWHCSDCASYSAYLGLVIPTGNRVCADYVAPAVVGNGFHAGIMSGASTELLLTDKEDYQLWGRVDTNGRYLFKNTQKRSFDLLGNEWSRYMMVWGSKDDYEAAVTSMNANAGTAAAIQQGNNRNYTPGINIFTADMHVKPRFQGRVNSALYYRSDYFRAELGWNVFARQKECVEFACDWNTTAAFADSSYLGGVGLNNSRTIYNDAQGATINNVYNPLRASQDGARAGLLGDGASTGSEAAGYDGLQADASPYDDFVIKASDVDFNSAATPATLSHTPYLTLGWTWDSDYNPQVSVGASYEFSASNAALNQWAVFGKFEMAF